MEGSDWNSVEQCFQALQFSDPAHREAIRQIPADVGDFSRFASLVHGGTAWRMGQVQGVARDPEFHALETMYLATLAKFEQSHAFKGALLRTSTDPIEAAPNRGEWQRLHGLILERVREELKEPQHRDQSKLDSLRELFKAEGFDEERVAARHVAMVQKHAQLGRQHRIQAMMLDGRFLSLSAFGPDTVRSLRAELAQTMGVQIDRIDLILGGNRLRDQETVAALGVEDDTIMTVVIGRPIPRAARQRDADAHADLLSAIRMRAVEAN
jgi:predicted NAD-dependent protein-ADP-ribosyltransferase YbiA (DUF1768 family)